MKYKSARPERFYGSQPEVKAWLVLKVRAWFREALGKEVLDG